jgi:gliding motility-associated-like protein
LVSHGNQTTNNFAVLNNLSDARYKYTIQPIDNAFNAGGKCYGGGVQDCLDLKHDYVQACKGETVELKSPGMAYWFSTTKGFLKISTSFSYQALATDTIVSVVPQSTDCNKNNIWVVRVNGSSKADKQTKFFCENNTVKIGIEPGWKNIVWTGLATNPATDSISIKVTGPIKLKVTASSSTCIYSKEFTIGMSKPLVSVAAKNLLLRQGESVQLTASGSKKYLWSPSIGLDNKTSATPIATPKKPTKYSVQGFDSIGCVASDTVTIDVEETAFVPAMFTPNGDGKNDEFKILGLTYGDEFQFTIFNREGVTVYESNEIVKATSQGWNGTNDGAPQPSGLYYWKIIGKQNDGQPLRLNGKTKGSVLLVR